MLNYNYIRPHGGLEGKRPAESAGAVIPFENWRGVASMGVSEAPSIHETMTLFHGTVMPRGQRIDKFRLGRAVPPQGRRAGEEIKALTEIDAVWFGTDSEIADPYTRPKWGGESDPTDHGQSYEVEATGRVVRVEVTDDESVREAMSQKPDIIILEDRREALVLDSDRIAITSIVDHLGEDVTDDDGSVAFAGSPAPSHTAFAFGDKLPPGHYMVSGQQFVRTGDATPLERWHGTRQPEGNVVDRFRPAAAGFEGRPALNETPGVYTSDNMQAAEQYAYGASVNARGQRSLQKQLYELRITPSVVVDVGSGEDDDAVRAAVAGGADVLEIPDFGEQSETVVLDPDLIEVVGVTDVEEGMPISQVSESYAVSARPSEPRPNPAPALIPATPPLAPTKPVWDNPDREPTDDEVREWAKKQFGSAARYINLNKVRRQMLGR